MNEFNEQNMHSLFAKFLLANNAYPKTINASRSSTLSKGDNEWVHPDIVSLEISSPTFETVHEVIKNIEKISKPQIKISSYELKLDLKLSNLKKYYFQAVSNSSWAHRGYLVAFNISDENGMKDELNRLVKAFGIGIYTINPKIFTSKKVDEKELFLIYNQCDCSEKNQLELEFLEKLNNIKNQDFIDFLDASYNISHYNISQNQSSFLLDSVLKQNFDMCETFNEDMRLAILTKGSETHDSNIELESMPVPTQSSSFDWEKEDWTRKKFKKVVFLNEDYPCENGIDVYLTICSIIHRRHPEIFSLYNETINQTNHTKNKVDFSLTGSDLREPKQIIGSVYLAEGNISNKDKQTKLLKLIELSNFKPSDFEIYIS